MFSTNSTYRINLENLVSSSEFIFGEDIKKTKTLFAFLKDQNLLDQKTDIIDLERTFDIFNLEFMRKHYGFKYENPFFNDKILDCFKSFFQTKKIINCDRNALEKFSLEQRSKLEVSFYALERYAYNYGYSSTKINNKIKSLYLDLNDLSELDFFINSFKKVPNFMRNYELIDLYKQKYTNMKSATLLVIEEYLKNIFEEDSFLLDEIEGNQNKRSKKINLF